MFSMTKGNLFSKQVVGFKNFRSLRFKKILSLIFLLEIFLILQKYQ